MATKKTNKTSHVMNLLTNGAPTENGEHADTAADTSSPQDSAAGTQEKKGDVQSHTVTPKKVTVVDEGSQNDRLSQEILNKLSEELEEEEGTEAAPTEPAPQTEAPAPAPAEPAPQAETPAPAPAEPAPQAEAPAPAPAEPAPQAETPAPTPTEPTPKKEPVPVQLTGKTAHHAFMMPSNDDSNLINGEYRFVNIMEHLMLRQDISSYMDQYNVCKCPHCMADVCALALTGLPAKYVVTKKDSLSPLISYYENRNKITILTALIKACNTVREHPHHKRS